MYTKCHRCKKIHRRARLALLIAAHNEELILDSTLKSAVIAGMCKHNIYVVDDNSSDETYRVASERLGKSNVLKVERSGKALALHKAIRHFKIEKKYTWIHFADADSVFSHNYFRIIRRDLNPKKYIAAIGLVQSMKGGWISSYRTCLYAFGQLINRRIEYGLRVIPVMPGPTSIYSTTILSRLNFFANTVTEDFDMTLQIYRLNLGRIQYIPTAVNYTQDPKTLKGYHKQVLRWSKGFFQSLFNHKIGRRPHMIDVYLTYQIFKTLAFALEILVLLPLRVSILGNSKTLLTLVVADFLMTFSFALFGAIATKRMKVLYYMPTFFILRAVDVMIFIEAMVIVSVRRALKLDRKIETGWSVADKRYELTFNVISDIARK